MHKIRTLAYSAAIAAALMAFAPFAATSARADGTAINGGTSRPTCFSLGLYYSAGYGTRSGCVAAPVVNHPAIYDANGRIIGATFTGVQQYDHNFWTLTLANSGMQAW